MDLEARLQQWGAEQCVGDVMMKLCSKLKVYSNYLNNYTTALSAIDKVPKNPKTEGPSKNFCISCCPLMALLFFSAEKPNLCSEPSSRELIELCPHTCSGAPTHLCFHGDTVTR